MKDMMWVLCAMGFRVQLNYGLAKCVVVLVMLLLLHV